MSQSPRPLGEGAEAERSSYFPPSFRASTTANPTEPMRRKTVAEEAAELIEQRKAFLRSGLNLGASGLEGRNAQTTDVTDRPPLFLGIGNGARDEFSNEEPSANAVSESPTGLDFDVYDRAFETEIKRIRSDRRKERSKTYMTKQVGEKEMDKYAGDDNMIVEEGMSLATVTNALASGSSAGLKGFSRAYEAYSTGLHDAEGAGNSDNRPSEGHEEGLGTFIKAASATGTKLSNLVTLMTQNSKDKT